MDILASLIKSEGKRLRWTYIPVAVHKFELLR